MRPAFFGSIHATLNHLLVGDRIRLARFAGKEVPSTRLDEIIYEDFSTHYAAPGRPGINALKPSPPA